MGVRSVVVYVYVRNSRESVFVFGDGRMHVTFVRHRAHVRRLRGLEMFASIITGILSIFFLFGAVHAIKGGADNPDNIGGYITVFLACITLSVIMALIASGRLF
jgi:Zn-dependent protease